MPKSDMYVLNGELINIGPWNDCGGENPLPAGAVFVKNGDYEITDRGRFVLPTQTDIIAEHKKVDVSDLQKQVEDLTKEVETIKAAAAKVP